MHIEHLCNMIDRKGSLLKRSEKLKTGCWWMHEWSRGLSKRTKKKNGRMTTDEAWRDCECARVLRKVFGVKTSGARPVLGDPQVIIITLTQQNESLLRGHNFFDAHSCFACYFHQFHYRLKNKFSNIGINHC